MADSKKVKIILLEDCILPAVADGIKAMDNSEVKFINKMFVAGSEYEFQSDELYKDWAEKGKVKHSMVEDQGSEKTKK